MTWGLHSFCISSVGGPVPIDVSNWGCAFSIQTHVASEVGQEQQLAQGQTMLGVQQLR